MGIGRTTMAMPLPYVLCPTQDIFWHALRAADKAEVIWCIKNGFPYINGEVDLAAGGKATPLAFAAKYRLCEIAAYLLENGADPNGCLGPNSCLMWALCNSRCPEAQVSMVELLLKHKADPNQRNKHGQLPLLCVVQDDLPDSEAKLAIVKLLLEAGAQPDACVGTTADEGGLTPLMQAAHEDRFFLVKLLIKYGADPDYAFKAFEHQIVQLTPDMQWLLKLWPSMTPTAIAAVEGDVGELTELLHQGADPMEEIEFPDCEKNSNVVQLAGYKVVCMRLCGKQPSEDVLQTLKRSMSWRPEHHYLFPPEFRSGVVYLRKALFANFDYDMMVLIFTFLPREWGLA